ncbi:hypothetical protein GCM10008915_55960 [Bifidobacterium pullorum subsp. gallinarum]
MRRKGVSFLIYVLKECSMNLLKVEDSSFTPFFYGKRYSGYYSIIVGKGFLSYKPNVKGEGNENINRRRQSD